MCDVVELTLCVMLLTESVDLPHLWSCGVWTICGGVRLQVTLPSPSLYTSIRSSFVLHSFD